MEKKEITLKEMQDIEFDILMYFKKICDENNLRYYLSYGTLIGAVRHQGFIPWDDDVDVSMPREDYYKLVEIVKKQTHAYYKLVSFETYPDFTAPLAKIIDTRTTLIQQYDFVEKINLGVYIDIFMLDGATDNYETAVECYDHAYEIYRKWRRADSKLFPPNRSKIYGLLRWLRNLPYKIRGISYYLSEFKENNSKYSFYDCKYVATFELGLLNGNRRLWEKKWYGEGCNVIFNGETFRAPVNYDDLLKQLYGDYMTLPPEEKRITHHNYILYWND